MKNKFKVGDLVVKSAKCKDIFYSGYENGGWTLSYSEFLRGMAGEILENEEDLVKVLMPSGTFYTDIDQIQLYTPKDVGINHTDFINSPPHYALFAGVEVKDVVKEILNRWENDAAIEMSFNQAGCMKEALQYLLRAPKKNEKEDVEKAVYYLNEILKEWDE